MKLHWMFILCMTVSLISSCASTSSQTPDLTSYQANTMPTGGSDAALAAHKTY